MRNPRDTAPYNDPDTPTVPLADAAALDLATPTSLASSTTTITAILNTNPTPTGPSNVSLKQATTSNTTPAPTPTPPTAQSQRPPIPETLTQALVDATPALKRLQQDLLILTSFPDNSSLFWRPPWFPPGPHAGNLWTLHNPPNVVTERIRNPPNPLWVVYTRRMRREGDPEPVYIKSWTQWRRVCDLYGVPRDFLDEGMVRLVGLGLGVDGEGSGIQAPRNWPLYPEPQIPGLGAYTLDPARCATHLPRKFHNLTTGDHDAGFVEQVEVDADGVLHVVQREEYVRGVADRRWNWVPWTREQEKSCAELKVRVRGWNSRMKMGRSAVESKQVEENEEDKERSTVKRARSLA
ncbi:hypothetical protein BKA63DRAFT_256198 [Paraphoma chrysanthemicola]|nr:hypothetical protein BKA63DRAFT_256198 [Paraphoma chrysanthemicola]